MEGWLGNAYPWVRAAHLIVVIFWIAGLFMLPRYLAYQAEETPGSDGDQRWIERTKRLRRIILNPAMIAAWLLGLALAANFRFGMTPGYAWIHAKLLLALLLSGYHGWMTAVAKRMTTHQRPLTSRALRRWNEAPAAFTILMVLLATVKPF